MSEVYKPIVGKNVIETLTLGMYEDPRFIYREYIQNAADQIDIAVEEKILNVCSEGEIKITIDNSIRFIQIEDNATGIQASKIRRFLGDVANSEKDLNNRKGFRGIGRMGGLGYCKKLVFETSYKGERVKNTMTLDAKLLKEIIENKYDNSDAASVISIITTVETNVETSETHFFKVTLLDVTNDTILDEKSVREYLSMVAPVPFSPKFKFGKGIKDYLVTKNLFLDEYETTLNTEPLYKAYKNFILTSKGEKAKVTSIDFLDVRNQDYQLLAVAWYGTYAKVNEVIDKRNIERGIRIRKSNITIGNEQTLFKSFPADRTNLRYIGEIHVIGDGFVPNARRDYFNDTNTLEEFENSLDLLFDNFERYIPHKASDLHNRLNDIKIFRNLNETYKRDRKGFDTQTEDEQRIEEVIVSLERAKKSEGIIDKIKADPNLQVQALFKSIIGNYVYSISDKELSSVYVKKIYPPLKFSNVSKLQEQILNDVVIFLQQELGHKKADPLIKKLQKKYNDE